ncbi:MAG: hypothetical protein QOG43_798 [Actinomycetota bacterium]|jgi:hypothetical protein|nr:hypothetical protein [Actinomycetota bacterium]
MARSAGSGESDGSGGDGPERIKPEKGPWTDRVVFGTTPGGAPFAFRPEVVFTSRADEAAVVANEVPTNDDLVIVDPDEDRHVRKKFRRLLRVNDPIATVDELRRRGFVAQVNYVFFALGGGGCGCGCGGCPPHPSEGWGCLGGQSVHPTPFGARSVHPTPFGARSVHPTPFGGQSVHPTPFGAESVHPTPFGAESVHPTPFFLASVHPTPHGGCGCGCGCGCGGGSSTQSVHPTPYRGQSVHPTPGRSSARPAPIDTPTNDPTKLIQTPAASDKPLVVVLDTGLPISRTAVFPPAMDGAPISPFDPAFDVDGPDLDPQDDLLDEVAGHGTFIAGLVTQVAPGCNVEVHKVLASAGDTDEELIYQRLETLTFAHPEHTVLSLSFGGYVPERPLFMAAAIARIQKQGVVVVAAAGNDGTCQPMFPAALPDVVSVGAIGPDGPAFFTNYGPWVRACAPGVDLLSTFFMFNGSLRAGAGARDPDNFRGWAIWSGTSFSAPVVAGALARTMIVERCNAQEAVARVIDNPNLLRLPGLGTVVNSI